MISQDKLNIIFNKIANLDKNFIDNNLNKIRDINECIDDLYNLVDNLEESETLKEYKKRKEIWNKFFPFIYAYKLYLDKQK